VIVMCTAPAFANTVRNDGSLIENNNERRYFEELLSKLPQFLQILARLSCSAVIFSRDQYYDVIKLAYFVQDTVGSNSVPKDVIVLINNLV
jgi:hypothetical protein